MLQLCTVLLVDLGNFNTAFWARNPCTGRRTSCCTKWTFECRNMQWKWPSRARKCCAAVWHSLADHAWVCASLSVCCQGSGKTLAFAIPLVHHILLDKQTDDDDLMQTSEAEDDDSSHASDGNRVVNSLKLEGDSEHANLHYVNFSTVFARWQHYMRQRFALSSNGKESFNPILDPDADPDHHQNLTTFLGGSCLTFPENFSQLIYKTTDR